MMRIRLLLRAGMAAGALLLIVLLLIWPGWAYHWDWTGFGDSFGKPKNPQGLRNYYPAKTLWDWLQLLIVPLAVAGAAGWLNMVQQRRDEQSAERREQEEEKRAARREQDAVLDTYLTQIGTLLLHENLGGAADEKAQHVARAQTSTAVRRLDSDRTAIMLRFLSESHLIAVLDLDQANLGGADLSQIDLAGANLTRSNLAEADLSQADLTGAQLSRAKLGAANLRVARLGKANLRLASLLGADLTSADLSRANLAGADLSHANLADADLSAASLRATNLTGANLAGANLSKVSLLGANLTGADLTRVNLSDAEDALPEQWAQAKSLQGATMPDGSLRS